MDHFVDERDYRLLDQDQYTFQVLRRIMGGACRLLLTDHETLILCYSASPYPVWIWTPDRAGEGEMEKAWQLVKEQGLLEEGCPFNMKHELADYFIKRAADEGKTMSVIMELLAYDCLNPIKPTQKARGTIHRCTMDDLDELVDFSEAFHLEVGIDQQSREAYRESQIKHLEDGNTYFWVDEEGNHVASCRYNTVGEMASIAFVYTPPKYRRKHYAENLVYEVTQIAREAGYVPMLYTDASYAASNACYRKVGYQLQGGLCTIKE